MRAQEGGLRIILVRPRDPNNIGAAARAMANFGLDDLWVVAPHPPVWREAKSAVGAAGLLRRARQADTLPEALEGCRRVWAASSMKGRRARLPVYDLPAWPPGEGAAAVLLGPEKTGLTAEDLAHASAVLRVPTAAACPSMNLAAAAAVVCYAWRTLRPASRKLAPEPQEAPAERKERVWRLLALVAARAGWPAGERMGRLKAAVYRSNVSTDEAGMLLELLRRCVPPQPGRST